MLEFGTPTFFEAIVEASPSAILLTDETGVIRLVNAETERMFGYSRDELVGLSTEVLVPERFRAGHPMLRDDYMKAPVARAMADGRELSGVRKDGTEIPVEIGLRPIETSEGTFVLGAITNVSERRAADRRFRQTVEAAPCAVMMVDRAGGITLANAEACELFGYANDELIGLVVDQLVPVGTREKHGGLRASYLQDPVPRAMGTGRDLHGVRKDGREVPIEIGLRPLELDGELFVLATIVDITERKRIEAQMDLYTAELERTNKDLEEFAYIASHDLRSPLRAIDNLASWISIDAGDALGPEPTEHLEKMRQRIRRMNRLLDDLLEYSRAGRQHGQREDADCRALVEETVAILDVPPGFSIDVAPDLPTIHTLKTPLATCLRNLVSNAINHHDREDGVISVSADMTDDDVVFHVRDDGPGIEARYHERIFKIFQSLTPKNHRESSGIGLALVKRTVEGYGGELTMDSVVGVGTVFHLRWPRRIQR